MPRMAKAPRPRKPGIRRAIWIRRVRERDWHLMERRTLVPHRVDRQPDAFVFYCSGRAVPLERIAYADYGHTRVPLVIAGRVRKPSRCAACTAKAKRETGV